MNSNIFNQLIRVYAGACKVPGVREDHVDMYCEDAWKLYQQMLEMPGPESEVNLQVLNSMLELYCHALKPRELEAKVLPEYSRHKIPYDVNTYAHLAKLHLTF